MRRLLVVVAIAGCGSGATRSMVPADAAPESVTIRDLRAELKAGSCDGKVVLDLVDELFAAGKPRDVLPVAADFTMRCEDPPLELDWKVFEAHKQLAQWQPAQTEADRLIDGDPRDSDYWWWRGEVDEKEKQDRVALADYRQSIANSDDATAARFAASRYLDPADRLGRGCEAAVVLDWFTGELGGTLGEDLAGTVSGFAASKTCDQLAVGHPKLREGDVVKVKLGGASAKFLVAPTAGTTIVSLDLAAKAGLAMDGDTAASIAEFYVRRGPLAAVSRLDLGAAHVESLDVIVADGLPAGIDGVLGLDVVARFARLSS